LVTLGAADAPWDDAGQLPAATGGLLHSHWTTRIPLQKSKILQTEKAVTIRNMN
jgi:hypothetical protein